MSIPNKPGCYAVWFQTGVVKFGRATSLAERLRNYRHAEMASGAEAIYLTREHDHPAALERFILGAALKDLTQLGGEMFICKTRDIADEILNRNYIIDENIAGSKASQSYEGVTSIALAIVFCRLDQQWCKSVLYDRQGIAEELVHPMCKQNLFITSLDGLTELWGQMTPYVKNIPYLIVEYITGRSGAINWWEIQTILFSAAEILNNVVIDAVSKFSPYGLDNELQCLQKFKSESRFYQLLNAPKETADA